MGWPFFSSLSLKVKGYFTPLTIVTASVMVLKVLLFDLIWAINTSFSGFSTVAAYANALLLGWFLAIPFGIWRRCWVQVFVMLLTDIWFIANLMYGRTYFTVIPAQSYLIASNLADFTSSVLASLRPIDALLPLTTLGALVCYLRWRLKPKKSPRYPIYFGVFGLLLSFSFIVTACHGGFRQYRKTISTANIWTNVPMVQTLAGTVIYDLIEQGSEVTPQEKVRVKEWLELHQLLTEPKDSFSGRVPRNLVLIICESLESWPIGHTFQGKEITPVLNRLVADSATLYIPNVQTQVAGGRSIDCQLLINAGMYPPFQGCYSILYPENDYHTLVQEMNQRDGIKSYILSVDKPMTWNQAVISQAFGVDSLITRDDWHHDEEVGGSRHRLSDRSLFRQAVGKMTNGKLWPIGEKAFVQVVTYSGHFPFVIPEEYRSIALDYSGYNERLVDYVTAVNYTDKAIEGFINYLQSRPDYQNTIVAIVGDHEGLAGDRAEILDSKGTSGLVSDGWFTPLIVLNSPRPGRIDKVIGQVDIHSTLRELLGLTTDGWRGMGISALSPAHPHCALAPSGELVGDTTRLSPEMRAHLLSARAVSDLILKGNLLPSAER